MKYISVTSTKHVFGGHFLPAFCNSKIETKTKMVFFLNLGNASIVIFFCLTIRVGNTGTMLLIRTYHDKEYFNEHVENA